MSERITVHGKTYQVGGDGHHQAMPLPDWFPPQLAAGWRETPERWGPDRTYGRVYRKDGEGLLILVSCAEQPDHKRWLHVSVSRRDRKIPTWEQMCQVKRVFIGDDRTALQIMPPKAKWVSIHPGVLHLWHCIDGDVTPDMTAGGESI